MHICLVSQLKIVQKKEEFNYQRRNEGGENKPKKARTNSILSHISYEQAIFEISVKIAGLLFGPAAHNPPSLPTHSIAECGKKKQKYS